MALFETLATLDKKFSWSFLGFVLAAIFGGITIYSEFLKETKPIITYEVLSNTNILDIKEKIGNLDIVYDGLDLQELKKTLSVITFKVENNGNASILNDHYDEESPLGVSIGEGKIIKAEIIGTTNSYIKEKLKFTPRNDKEAIFSKVILEPNEGYSAKILIIHPDSITPSIEPIGKVANVPKVQILNGYTESSNETYLAKTFGGGPLIQLARFPGYFFGFIFIFAGVIIPSSYISDKLEECNKNKIIKRFRAYSKLRIENKEEHIFKIYREEGLSSLSEINRLILNDRRLKPIIKRAIQLGDDIFDEPYIRHRQIRVDDKGTTRIINRSHLLTAKTIHDLGFAKIVENDVEVDQNMKRVLGKFIDFASIKES